MSIWYAVFVGEDNTDQPIALFKSVVLAQEFATKNYADRSRVQPIALNASFQPVTVEKSVVFLS